MKNFNIRNANSDSKKDKRAERQKRLNGPLPYHLVNKKAQKQAEIEAQKSKK